MMNTMLLPKDEKVLDFLFAREMTKELIERIVFMLPKSYFYGDDIENDVFKSYRVDLNDLLEEARSKDDRKSWIVYGSLWREYNAELLDLVTLKRRFLVFGLMMQEEDKRREILFNLIHENHLQKRVLKLKEVYRL
ncbi:hypothetical protein AB3329_01840 [Streptococcus sp. H31]|uniref:hypothetical protein n=1 Tax=Streptococcus huangxiaojuni TaxID=3237239 RepID=UPI0034A163D2